MMKQINRLLMTLLALAVVITFGATKATAGGCAGGALGEGGIAVDKKAPGTKYEGPLTIHYVPASFGTFDISFFARLRKGSTLYAFSGTSYAVILDSGEIQGAIEAFFDQIVVPLLYPDQDPLDPLPWALKSVDQLVDDAQTEGDCCNGMFFNIVDVVVAVQD
ncbi:MAG: hypothetical protein PF690_07430 [Deltaproteobacteria bacterium]|nr:hypothetical protein [Deltaproteobacteria bacterium]